jgi:hypothetical protein
MEKKKRKEKKKWVRPRGGAGDSAARAWSLGATVRWNDFSSTNQAESNKDMQMQKCPTYSAFALKIDLQQTMQMR